MPRLDRTGRVAWVARVARVARAAQAEQSLLRHTPGMRRAKPKAALPMPRPGPKCGSGLCSLKKALLCAALRALAR